MNKMPRRLKIGLRKLLLILTVICLGFGWYYQFACQNSRATQFLRSEGVDYYYFEGDFNRQTQNPEFDAPDWQRKLLGDDYFLEINALTVGSQNAADPMFWKKLQRHRHALQHVQSILIWCGEGPLPEKSMETLSSLSELNSIDVREGQVTSKWLNQCSEAKNLSSIRIHSPSSFQIDIQALAGLRQVTSIILSGCGVSLDEAEFLRDQLRSTMIVVLENNDSNQFD
jgi:hypothetical protein